MRCDLTLIFTPRQSLDLTVQVEPTPALATEAREWFEQTWTALGCEPLRPSGKVLLLDKIMGVADALGYAVLSSDQSRAGEYARQTALALGKPRITVDLPGLSVGY
ncbi:MULTISPECIES: hypothetical protein [unclassified Achromobacter]|uniref:hypothetical protein n=1 Tax=unclassified Achromobacter TaxID=2626865 RepID=UPI000B518EFD|nr:MULTISPECIES: hypothetical protein [unclassified Achromobacter]OWT74391.1 hypothetical protein CEY05_17330 [Achromobacter sp. HZ34]OWT78858.1 hypothetical protein CEY04_07250 [Achromobacter sp. HZ28]